LGHEVDSQSVADLFGLLHLVIQEVLDVLCSEDVGLVASVPEEAQGVNRYLRPRFSVEEDCVNGHLSGLFLRVGGSRVKEESVWGLLGHLQPSSFHKFASLEGPLVTDQNCGVVCQLGDCILREELLARDSECFEVGRRERGR